VATPSGLIKTSEFLGDPIQQSENLTQGVATECHPYSPNQELGILGGSYPTE